MLYKEAVDASILELLRSLQSRQYLRGFNLAGGTALALYNGHRKSVDFDFSLLFSAPNTLKGAISEIEVDIIAHRYNLIFAPVTVDNINILSEQDIIAMKLNAISTSGQRIKDFIDIYYLLDKYDIKTMLSYYLGKYNQKSDLLVLKSLIYFEDVDESEWPVLIKEPDLKWKDVRRKIQKKVLDYTRRESGNA
jgi:hypothetical protein